MLRRRRPSPDPRFSGVRARRGVLGVTSALAAAALLRVVTPAHAGPPAEVEGQTLDVKADKLDVDIDKGTATLEGHVSAALGELVVECPKIEVRYDEVPKVRWARGSGGVTARLKGIEATALSMELDVARRSVRLSGSVKLSRGRGWVTAETAAIDIATRRVTLDDVKGSIPVQAPSR
jgi:lipopolysaccharide export system protein LptA